MQDKTFEELMQDKTSKELAQILIDQMNSVRAGTITPKEATAIRKAVVKEMRRRKRHPGGLEARWAGGEARGP